MSLNVSKLSYQPSFKAANPKLKNTAKQIFKDKDTVNYDNVNNVMSAIAWVGLTIAFIASGIYGVVSTLKERSNNEKKEQVVQPLPNETSAVPLVFDKIA